MNAKLPSTLTVWADPDDAPELDAEFFANATPTIGGHVVPFDEYGKAVRKAVRGRPVGSTKAEAKQAVTVRYSPDVLESFKATGAGWQARMNDALRDWLRTHPLA